MTWSTSQKGFRTQSTTAIGGLVAKSDASIVSAMAPAITEHTFLYNELRVSGMIDGLGTTQPHFFLIYLHRQVEETEAEQRIEESSLSQWDVNREPGDSVIWKWTKKVRNPSTEVGAFFEWKIPLPKNGLPAVEDKGWAISVYNLGNNAVPSGARCDLVIEYMGVWAS